MSDESPQAGAQEIVPVEAGASVSASALKIDPRLLEILVCPLTKTTLIYDARNQELVSEAARLAFPIRDGIPIMTPEEARAISD